MDDVNPSPLPLTGERTVPGLVEERYWFLRHEAVYRWWVQEQSSSVRTAGQPPVIVDAGCGEGYGAALLADAGGVAIGVDYDESVVDHVRDAYPKVSALRANLVALPFADGSVDAVISLQVIEHLWDLGIFLRECRRVLGADGALVVSTPNRPVFSPGLGPGERPTNPFHVEEFDAGQVAQLLTDAGFRSVEVHGLHHGPRLREWEQGHGSIVAAHIEAALSGTWGAELRSLLPSLAVDDFVVAEAQEAEDIIAVARG